MHSDNGTSDELVRGRLGATILGPRNAALDMIAGSARISVIDAEGRSFMDDVGVGDLWYFPAGLPHSIQALADGCEFLLVFDDGGFSENETFLVCDWFAHTPREVLAQNFGVPAERFDAIPLDFEHSRYVFDAPVPGELHWHPNGDEWQYYPRGRGTMTVFASGGKARTFDYQAGDVSLNQWLALTPPELVKAHLNLGDETVAALSKTKPVVVR